MKHTRLTLRARLRLAAVAAVLIPAAVTATPALAHDSLSSTTPAKDAVVTTAPDTVSLTLSEPPLDSEKLNTSVLTVTDGAGKTVSDAKVTVYGPTLSTAIAAGTAGTYTVLWRAVSSDGHPIEGQYAFTVQPAPGGDATTPAASATPSAPSTADPSTTQAGSTTPGTVPPPDNANAPLTLGISAAVLAAALGATFYLRRKRNNSGA